MWQKQRFMTSRLLGLAGDEETGRLGSHRVLLHGDWVGACQGAPIPPGELSFIPHSLYSHLLPPAHSQPPRAHTKKLLFTLEKGIEAHTSSWLHTAWFTGQAQAGSLCLYLPIKDTF